LRFLLGRLFFYSVGGVAVCFLFSRRLFHSTSRPPPIKPFFPTRDEAGLFSFRQEKNDRSPESSPVADAPPHGRFNNSTRRFFRTPTNVDVRKRPSRSINRRGA
jgi:hypothetical protein